MAEEKNAKGEFALYDAGKLIGYAPVVQIDYGKVISTLAPVIQAMKADALKAGISLRVDSGLRTWNEQLYLRQQNAPVTKKTDNTFLLTADSTLFAPWTGKPGFSNHQDGKAIDFNVTNPTTKAILPSYAWLVRNAYKYGFIRTVPDERWHWEFLPDDINPFKPGISPTHYSWDGMAPDLAKLAAEVQAGRIKRLIKTNPGKTGVVVALLLFVTGAGLFFLNRSKKNKK